MAKDNTKAELLNAAVVDDVLEVRVTGVGSAQLVARCRQTNAGVIATQPAAAPSSDVYAFPIESLSPYPAAQTTFDVELREQRKSKRIKVTASSRLAIHKDSSFAVMPFGTPNGNLSISILRTGPLSSVVDARGKTGGDLHSLNPERLKVTVFVQQFNFSGGKTTAMFQLAETLQSAGFDVTICALWLNPVAMIYQPPLSVRLDFVDCKMRYPAEHQPLSVKHPHLNASRETIGHLEQYLAKIDADIVYLPDYDSELYEIFTRCLPERVLSILGDHNPGRYKSALRLGHVPSTSARDLVFSDALRRFDAIHVINGVVGRAYAASTNRPIIDIPNAVAAQEARKPTFLNSRRIIAAGRLVHDKGFHDLIRAFASVSKRQERWTLSIFGKGDEHASLSEMIREQGLEGTVTLHGPTTNLLDEMRQSAFHVTSSRSESFGLTIVEAMSVSLPVVSQHKHPGTQLLLSERRGFVPARSSVRALASLMRRMMAHIEEGDPSGVLRETADRSYKFSRSLAPDRIRHRWSSDLGLLHSAKIGAGVAPAAVISSKLKIESNPAPIFAELPFLPSERSLPAWASRTLQTAMSSISSASRKIADIAYQNVRKHGPVVALSFVWQIVFEAEIFDLAFFALG